MLPGTPWLPEEPGLPEAPGLPEDPDEGDELGIEGIEEDEDSLVVAQPASTTAQPTAITPTHHHRLLAIRLDSLARG